MVPINLIIVKFIMFDAQTIFVFLANSFMSVDLRKTKGWRVNLDCTKNTSMAVLHSELQLTFLQFHEEVHVTTRGRYGASKGGVQLGGFRDLYLIAKIAFHTPHSALCFIYAPFFFSLAMCYGYAVICIRYNFHSTPNSNIALFSAYFCFHGEVS